MITKNDAINIATSIANSAKFDITNHGKYDTIPAIRGAIFRSLDDIWYNVLPLKIREQFNSDTESGHEVYMNIARDILNT